MINNDKKNQLNKNFARYKVLNVLNKDKPKYEPFCVASEYGFFFTYADMDVDNEYVITPENLHTILDIRGCLIAKRLLRFHSIPDNVIIKNYITYLNVCGITIDDWELVDNIHNQILPIFNDLTTQLKQKPFYFRDIF